MLGTYNYYHMKVNRSKPINFVLTDHVAMYDKHICIYTKNYIAITCYSKDGHNIKVLLQDQGRYTWARERVWSDTAWSYVTTSQTTPWVLVPIACVFMNYISRVYTSNNVQISSCNVRTQIAHKLHTNYNVSLSMI